MSEQNQSVETVESLQAKLAVAEATIASKDETIVAIIQVIDDQRAFIDKVMGDHKQEREDIITSNNAAHKVGYGCMAVVGIVACLAIISVAKS